MDQRAPDGSAAAGVARQAGRQLEVERSSARCAASYVMLSGHACSDSIERPAGERTHAEAANLGHRSTGLVFERAGLGVQR